MVSLNVSLEYAYPYPRIMASKSYLLKDEDIRALAAVNHLDGYITFLERTHYREDIGKIGELDIDNIESMFLSNLINISKSIFDFAPKRTKSLFESLMLKHEIELIKLILNRFEEVKREDRSKIDYSIYYPILSSEIKNCLGILDMVKTRMDAIDVLKETKYGFLSTLSAEEINIGRASDLLDKYYFHELWKTIEGLSTKDAEYARRLIGTEIELTNIMTLFRSMIYGYKAERFIIPINYKLDKIMNLLLKENLDDMVSALSNTPYGEIISDGFRYYEEHNSILGFEMNIKEYLLEEHKKVFRGYPFHLGILLGFLKLKEYEVKNLISILVGIEYNISMEERKSLLIC